MKKIIFLSLIFIMGCARVEVKAPKEPIKVDITMRLDIYQHIQRDIDKIEDMISGEKKNSGKSRNETKNGFFLKVAFAEEELFTDEMEEAISRRRERLEKINTFKKEGKVGENRFGLLEIRGFKDIDIENIVREENNDRMIIYKMIARKNNVPIEEVQKLYSERLQKDSPPGTPIEVLDVERGGYEWRIK